MLQTFGTLLILYEAKKIFKSNVICLYGPGSTPREHPKVKYC